MANALLLTADLLFGSNVQGTLAAAGHSVELVADEAKLKARLDDAGKPAVDVIVVDLTDADLDGAGIVESLLHSEALGATHTLGFYSHVDAPARQRAEAAGVDLVVPRSRMAREGAELVARLSSG